MVGLVIVSHSRRLAEGLKELVDQLTRGQVAVVQAGGIADGALGTDAVLVAAAIGAADSGDGVLVLVDLGSAILSAETALDLIPEESRARVRLSGAPLVEGAIAAGLEASFGSDLARVADAADEARNLEKIQ
jgi:phosphoenolpyruvate---glycerone phosphotransferase subunit DhaM